MNNILKFGVEQSEAFEKTGEVGNLLALLFGEWNKTVDKKNSSETTVGVNYFKKQPLKKIFGQMFDFYKNSKDSVIMMAQFKLFREQILNQVDEKQTDSNP